MKINRICKICSNLARYIDFCSLGCANKSIEGKKYIKKCKFCKTEFLRKRAKNIFCSKSCSAKNSCNGITSTALKKRKKTLLKKYGVEHNFQIKGFNQQRKQTYLNKYGVDHNSKIPGASQKAKKKRKETMQKKYGVSIAFQLPNSIKKSRETSLQKYGVQYIFENEKMSENARERGKDKYGVNNVFQAEEVKRKSKKTMLEKYGVEYALQNKEIKIVAGYNKEKTNLAKYGVKSTLSLPKIQEKGKQTCLNKYGTEYYSQTEEFKNKYRKQTLQKFYEYLFNDDKFNTIIPLFKLEDYKGIVYKNEFHCKNCNKNFKDNLIQGKIPRCPICFPFKKSIGEQELCNYIKSLLNNKYEIIENKRILPNKKSLDIYIPDLNLAFEYNGLFWHSESSGKNKDYHKDKTKEAEKINCHLIHIWEDDWIHKQDVVKNRIKNLLNVNEERIFAKKCIIKEINIKIKNEFLNKYHLQGADKSSIKYGAFYNNELVAVMTFGGGRIALGSLNIKNEYELMRFATSQKVIGVGSKLLKYFIRKYNPKKIISYADRCWTTELKDNLYQKMGFKKISDGTPNYWYLTKLKRNHRFNFRKNILKEKLENFNPELTEWENMQLNGYDRIWDCGSFKYELIFQ